MKCDNIFSIYAEDLDRVEKSLRTIFSSDAFIIPMIGEHIIRSGGKRLRPLFLILSADLARYRGENRIILAGIIEAIHTASLLHDDVVDGAEVRRGQPASHVVWGNQAVILVGDYIYANALRISVLQEDLRIIEALSGAIAAMTEGEIIQLNRVADPEITLDEYYHNLFKDWRPYLGGMQDRRYPGGASAGTGGCARQIRYEDGNRVPDS